jgi:hypothetical protein
MTGTIYLLSPSGTLSPLHESPYDSEALLQRLLADHPSLLAGEQMDSARPRRWLLVTREAPVPGDEDASFRWSVDHLFLDQEGIPTLVEVKRSTDTRIRREVIGQMLDYAANAALYVPVERMKELLARRCTKEGRDPDAEVRALLVDGTDADAFWQSVKTNLQAKKLRLVFVADVIPTELRVVVEFLNEQMDPTEVLAVEVKQFVGADGTKTLVPRLVGQSVAAEQRKSASGGPKRQWDEGSFFADLAQRKPADVGVARRIYAWANERGLTPWWGHGSLYGSFIPTLTRPGEPREQHYCLALWTNGFVEMQFQWMVDRGPFAPVEKRLALLRRLNQVPGVALPEDAIGRRPSVTMATLAGDGVLAAFLKVWDGYLEEVRAT